MINDLQLPTNSIGDVMVSVLASSAVDRGFESRLGQTRDREERHVYPRTVVSVSEHYATPTQRVGLEQRGPHRNLIEN